MIDLLHRSRENEDFVLDTPFTPEEIESVLRNLKLGKSAGYDQVQPEHLKYGGPALYIWIKHVANAIIELECVPESLKVGIVTPLYKGGGKDPLDRNSYRGITLSPVLAKVLESLILVRLKIVLAESGFPHMNQTVYQKNVSCSEAIFSTLETVSSHCKNGDKMYLCFYNLQRAFDSVQYPILFKRLYDAGINGKIWRLIRNWHADPMCMIRINGSLSSKFKIEHDVLQGSVLSPVLFLLVMDPLLNRPGG